MTRVVSNTVYLQQNLGSPNYFCSQVFNNCMDVHFHRKSLVLLCVEKKFFETQKCCAVCHLSPQFLLHFQTASMRGGFTSRSSRHPDNSYTSRIIMWCTYHSLSVTRYVVRFCKNKRSVFADHCNCHTSPSSQESNDTGTLNFLLAHYSIASKPHAKELVSTNLSGLSIIRKPLY